MESIANLAGAVMGAAGMWLGVQAFTRRRKGNRGTKIAGGLHYAPQVHWPLPRLCPLPEAPYCSGGSGSEIANSRASTSRISS